MSNHYVELPTPKAQAFKALCVESGAHPQVAHFTDKSIQRVYVVGVSDADFDALKELNGDAGGTAIL